jgi:predicted GNAT family N-acyltransferase
MNIKTIEWQQALPIRHQVLWPDKSPLFCKVEGDEAANHYGAYVDNELICVASIFVDSDSARLRKFATLSSYQGQGIGSQVIEHVINDLKTTGMQRFWCDARSSAVGFYQRFGLAQQGNEFLKSGIPYFKMEIWLGEQH